MFRYLFSPEHYRIRSLALAIILLTVGFGLTLGSVLHRDRATAAFALLLVALGVLGLLQSRRFKN